jgi:ATP-dependent HslUV protease ATP-binding subunit HslU
LSKALGRGFRGYSPNLNSARSNNARVAGTEGIDLNFTEESIVAIANIAAEINASIENIGARRLHTVMERVLDELSYSATDRSGEAVTIDEVYVQKHVGDLAKNADLSKFIL